MPAKSFNSAVSKQGSPKNEGSGWRGRRASLVQDQNCSASIRLHTARNKADGRNHYSWTVCSGLFPLSLFQVPMRSLFLRTKPPRSPAASNDGPFATPTKSPPASSRVASKQQESPRSPSLSPTSLSFASDHDDESANNKHLPLLRMYFGIFVWLMLSALLLWHSYLPKATQWWIDLEDYNHDTNAAPLLVTNNDRYGSLDAAMFLDSGLPGGYTSLEEMQNRSLRFPSVAQRVKVYMTDWFAECNGASSTSNNHNSRSTTMVKFAYVQDAAAEDEDEPAPPLLLIQEPQRQSYDSDTTATAPPPRTFVLDSAIADKGARVFYLRADEIRRCDDPSCKDAVQYIFPSLHHIDMAALSSSSSSSSSSSAFFAHYQNGYVGNALDARDGNSNGVVPILLQFGDTEVSRAYVPLSHSNETYPVVPIFKKFRKSMSMKDLEAVVQCAQSSIGASAETPSMYHPSTYKKPIF
jgi:hypothetical protein